ncbi:MAG: hypothetical protein CVU22_14875 [Betaproteobacteria bacterium HGW-Betaproteobacteria-16]|nr:MAG: hypothetical protein CVU22_14875 [Betaproteobacteria bacterium HGW-Betaproteobacteria-16]
MHTNQKTTLQNTIAAVHQIEASVLDHFFVRRAPEVTLEYAIGQLAQLLESGQLHLRASHRSKELVQVQQQMQDLHYLKLQPLLPVLLKAAQAHVTDVGTGLDDGTYHEAENPDHEDTALVVQSFSLCVPLDQPSGHTHCIDLSALTKIAKSGGLDAMLALTTTNPGGIRRLLTEQYFSYSLWGEDVIFDNKLRKEIEDALGEPLQEVVYPDFAMEIALALPAQQVDAFLGLMEELKRSSEPMY